MNEAKKNIKLILAFGRVGWRNGVEYRKDVAISIINFLLMTCLTIIFWHAIFGSNITIEGWEIKELVILGIFGSTAWSLSDYFAGSWLLPEKIIMGELDKYISKPINPLFGIIMESSQFDECVKGIIGFIIMMSMSFITYEYQNVTFFSVVLGVLLMGAGVGIISLMRVTVSMLSFWLGESSGLNTILHLQDFGLERYPLEIFNKVKVLFVTALPIAFISNYPAEIFLGKSENTLRIILVSMCTLSIWFIVVKIMWRKGIKKYESTGC